MRKSHLLADQEGLGFYDGDDVQDEQYQKREDRLHAYYLQIEQASREKKIVAAIAESQQEEERTPFFDSEFDLKSRHNYARSLDRKNPDKLSIKAHSLEKGHAERHLSKKAYLELNLFKRPDARTSYPHRRARKEHALDISDNHRVKR